MNTFDEVMLYCPFLKKLIEDKITEEIEKAKKEKQKEMTELKASIEGLTTTILMGDE